MQFFYSVGINDAPGNYLQDKWDIPQNMSVADQLKAGVRFMDIRLATTPLLKQPSITHNYKYQDFEFLVKDTVNFLKVHKNEVVVIRLKEGKKGAIYYGYTFDWEATWSEVDRVLGKYSSYIYSSRKNPLKKKVKHLRGKIIICQESITPKSTYKRFTCEGSWSSTNTNDPVKLKGKMTDWLNSLPISTSKFHFLEAICTPAASDVENALNPINCKSNGNRLLYEPKSLEDMAKECNYEVYEWLKSRSIYKAEAVMIDFVNPTILDLIIAKN